MRFSFKTVIAVAALFTCVSAQASIVFDNTSGTVAGGWGYFNPGAAWGDEVTLDNAGTITALAFDLSNVFSGYSSGNLTLSVYNVDAGTDGLLQTADDKIGAFIGSFTQAANLTSNSRFTLSGFSFDVPANFIYTVTNGSGLSYVLEATEDAATTGTSSNLNIWANFSSSGLPVGTQSSGSYASSFGNNQVQIQGTSVLPEPNAFWPTASIAGFAILRFWRARQKGL